MSSEFSINIAANQCQKIIDQTISAQFSANKIEHIQDKFEKADVAYRMVEWIEDFQHLSPDSVTLIHHLSEMCDMITEVIQPYLYDSLCPGFIKNIDKSIQQIKSQLMDDTMKDHMNRHLQKEDVFNYFFTPGEIEVELQNITVYPPLFMADIMTLVADLQAQKENLHDVKFHIKSPDSFCINGAPIKVFNSMSDQNDGLKSIISLEPFKPWEDLVAIDDDGASVCILSQEEYTQLRGTTNQHPISHRPLAECNVWALIKQTPLVTMGVNVPSRLRHQLDQIGMMCRAVAQTSEFFPTKHIFSTSRDNIHATEPVQAQRSNQDDIEMPMPVPRQDIIGLQPSIVAPITPAAMEPIDWDDPTESPEDVTLNRWLYSEDDPLRIRFINAPIDLSVGELEEQMLVNDALASEGRIRPPYTQKTMAIHRFFTHWRLETDTFTRNPELKNRIDAIDSPDQLEDDDLMRVPLNRFIELMRIKKAFLTQFGGEAIRSFDENNPWEAFCALKAEMANQFRVQ